MQSSKERKTSVLATSLHPMPRYIHNLVNMHHIISGQLTLIEVPKLLPTRLEATKGIRTDLDRLAGGGPFLILTLFLAPQRLQVRVGGRLLQGL